MNEGDTTEGDFYCEQYGLYDQSRTCHWCQEIFHCIDVDSPVKAHPYCRVKEWHKTCEPTFDPEDFM